MLVGNQQNIKAYLDDDTYASITRRDKAVRPYSSPNTILRPDETFSMDDNGVTAGPPK